MGSQTISESPVATKICTCDDKFVLFLKSETFESILKQAMQNVMGEVIRTILQHQIKDDLCTLVEKVNKMEFDLQCIKLKKCGFQSSVGNHRQNMEQIIRKDNSCGLITIPQEPVDTTDSTERNKTVPEKKMIGVVKFFNLDKGYGFITTRDTNANIFVHKNGLSKPTTSLKAGEKVQFVINSSKKGPEAKDVTVVEQLQDSSPNTTKGERKSYFKNRVDDWNGQTNARCSPTTYNMRRHSRRRRNHRSPSASGSSRGSIPNVHSRTASTESRVSHQGNRRDTSVIRGTLSSVGSNWGSTHSILSDSNQLSLSTLFSYSSEVYQSQQFCPSEPPESPYYNYQSQD